MKCSECIISFTPLLNVKGFYQYFHFTDEKTEREVIHPRSRD